MIPRRRRLANRPSPPSEEDCRHLRKHESITRASAARVALVVRAVRVDAALATGTLQVDNVTAIRAGRVDGALGRERRKASLRIRNSPSPPAISHVRPGDAPLYSNLYSTKAGALGTWLDDDVKTDGSHFAMRAEQVNVLRNGPLNVKFMVLFKTIPPPFSIVSKRPR
jgi:hypothetical protein